MGRNDDINRIEELLRKSTGSPSGAKVIFVLILLAGIGFLASWYISSRPHPVNELTIIKLKPNVYEVVLDKGGWYDTGIWVRPGYMVEAVAKAQTLNAADEPQPFIIAIDNTEDRATLTDDGAFLAQVHTTDDPKLKSDAMKLALVKNQGKIYLRIAPEASRDKLKMVVFLVQELTEEDKKAEATDTTQKDAAASNPTANKGHPFIKWGLIAFGVIVGGILLFLLVVHIAER